MPETCGNPSRAPLPATGGKRKIFIKVRGQYVLENSGGPKKKSSEM